MGRDKIHPAEHDSSTRFIGSKDRKLPRVREERSRKLSNLALALFLDTFSDGKRRLSNIWQIKLVPSRDRIATIVSWINSAAFDASIRSSNPRLTPFRIHFVTRSRKIRPLPLKFRRTMSLTCQNRTKTRRESCGESF